MSVIRFALVVGAAMAALPAFAAPVYMTCVFANSEGAKSEVKVTANEAEGIVNVLVPATGFTARMPGAFTPDRVVFKDDMLDYAISRVDLTATRKVRMISSTEAGKCKVEQPPKRAF